jgi:hypothetical protein
MAIVAIGIETLMICSLISTPKKEAWRHITAKADKVTGMQFPLSVRLVECAAGSMVLQTAANF